jgi:hypothetical protein
MTFWTAPNTQNGGCGATTAIKTDAIVGATVFLIEA